MIKKTWDRTMKRWKVETEFKVFWFNEESNADNFIILWRAGEK